MRCQRNNCNGPLQPALGGKICLICGHFEGDEIITVMQFSGKTEYTTKAAEYRRPDAKKVAIKFYDSIKKQRLNGVSWDTIADLFCKAGHYVTSSALRIRWHEEHNNRCEEMTGALRHAKKARVIKNNEFSNHPLPNQLL